LKKLSVAVVIDQKTTRTPAADGKLDTKVEDWSAEKLKEFEALVTGSLALDKKRGDTLEIKSIAFAQEDFEEAQKILDASAMRGYVQSLITYGVFGVIIVLFFFFVVRPYIKWITENTTDSVDTFLPQTIEELEKIQKSSTMAQLDEVVPDIPDRLDPEKVEGDMMRDKIVTMIDNNPHKASLVLKEWLLQSRPVGAGGEEKDESASA
jgi:flagellar M-ring protein FliF